MFGPTPHQRFNTAIAARPAAVASPLSTAAPAASVAPAAAPAAPPKSAIGAGAGLPPAGPPQPGDWAVPQPPSWQGGGGQNGTQPGGQNSRQGWQGQRGGYRQNPGMDIAGHLARLRDQRGGRN